MVNKEAIKSVTEFFENAEDWEKAETNFPDVFIVKLPGTKAKPQGRLMVEINPINKETGKPTKRKGLFVSGEEMFMQFREALGENKVLELAKIVDSVNGSTKHPAKKAIIL